MIKKYKYKPIVIEAIQFDGKNFEEIINFIHPMQGYYAEYYRREISRIGFSDDDGIFWLTRNCWVSKRDGLCSAHESSFESFLCASCEEIKEG